MILALLLCAAIIASAIWAERSAQANHRLRAVLLNLCGIGCLAFGLMTIFAWSRAGIDPSLRLAMAPSGQDPGKLVSLMADNDKRPDQAPSAGSDAVSNDGDVVAEAVAEEPPLLEQLDEAMDETSQRDEGLPLAEQTQVEIDYAARPEWVDRPETDVGDVHQISVTSDLLYFSVRESRKDLRQQLKTATDQYINDIVGNSNASRWIGWDEERICRTLVSSDHYYDEKVVSPTFGAMYQSHALLEFGPVFHDEIQQSWHRVVARTRLAAVTIVGGGVLGLLALMFGYFTADTATKGFYTRRLKFITTLAILGLIAGGIMLARSIPWLWL